MKSPNLATYLEQSAVAHPAKTALIFEGQGKWTFEEVDAMAGRVANGLLALGVKKGDRVTLFLPNGPEFFFWYFGTVKMGAVVNPLNLLLKERELDYIFSDCEPTVVVTAREVAGEVFKVFSKPECKVRTMILVDGDEGDRVIRHEKWIAGQSDDFSALRVDGDDLAAILYTSGTTGKPKGVMLTHANLWTNARHCADWAETTHNDIGVCSLPLFHSYALSHVVGELWVEAATLVWQKRFDATATLEALANYGATCFHGVATMYYAILNHPDVDEYAKRIHLRYCVTGAAVTPEPILKAWNSRFSPMCEGYGTTEAAPVVCVNPLTGRGVQKPNSCGIPLVPEIEMEVMDEEGGPVKQGEVGELVYRGPNIMKGYWGKPEATAKVLRGGWYHSGDMAYYDEDRYYYIKDRKNDMIIRAAFNIYPKEIEDLLYLHEAIGEAQVVGIPDLAKGEEVVACIALKPGMTLTEQEVIDFCRANLATYKTPKYVKFFDALPKTATGKLEKVTLRSVTEKEFGKSY
jgi:long-chain acyl-CoA synthetase